MKVGIGGRAEITPVLVLVVVDVEEVELASICDVDVEALTGAS